MFGVVETMNIVDWDWATLSENQQSAYNHFCLCWWLLQFVYQSKWAIGTKSTDVFQNHKPSKYHPYFLIVKDPFPKIKLLEEHWSCLWMRQGMFGFVEGIKKENWAGPHNTNPLASCKQKSFWNSCRWELFSVSGQCRKYFHLWEQWRWTGTGIQR